MMWDIVPFGGIGGVKFGMTPTEVVRARPDLGPSELTDMGYGEFREVRKDKKNNVTKPIFDYRDGKLYVVHVGWDIEDVYLNDTNISKLDSKQTIKFFESINGQVLIGPHNEITFKRLGICISGIYDDDGYRDKTDSEALWDGYIAIFDEMGFLEYIEEASHKMKPISFVND
jgi:hypothetical protein